MKIIKKRYLLLLLLLISSYAYPESGKTAEYILKKIDEQRDFKTAEMSGRMKIFNRILRVKSFALKQRGQEDAYMVFTNDEDYGTKFLKLENQMWIYYPDVEEIIKISGHLLREGIMGSDYSYEDSMENEQLLDDYDVKLAGKEVIDDQELTILELTAKRPDVSYPKRKLWIDENKYVITKMELYALSGSLLKVLKIGDYQKIDNKWIGLWSRMENVLRKGSYTEFEITSIELDIPISEKYFGKGILSE